MKIIYFMAHGQKKKGYSGVCILTKHKPLRQISLTQLPLNLKDCLLEKEGRIIILEYDKFFIMSVYFINSQAKLKRLPDRLKADEDLSKILVHLKTIKPTIFAGDCNISQTILDIAEPKKHLKDPGYSIEERESFGRVLATGYVDSYRELHKDKKEYSFWCSRAKCRERNIGYRCDLICVSAEAKNLIEVSEVKIEMKGSDHCPVSAVFNLNI